MIKGKKLFCLKIVTALAVLALCIGPALASFPAYASDSRDGGAPSAGADQAAEDTAVEAAPAVEATDVEADTEANAEVNAEAAEADTGEAVAAENTEEAAATTAAETTQETVETTAEVTETEVNTEAVEAAPAAEADTGEAVAAENTEEAATTTAAETTQETVETTAEVTETEVNTKAVEATAVEAPAADVGAATPDTTQSGAVVTTDQADYGPNDLATFEGGGFTPNSEVTLTLSEPNGVETVWTATADDAGSFTTTYQLVAGMQDTYTLTATDGTNSTQASFTDAWTYYGALGQKIWTVDDPSATIYWISNQPGATNTTTLQQDVTNERVAPALNGRVQPIPLLFQLRDGGTNLTSQFTVTQVAPPSGNWLTIGAGNTGTIAGTVTAGAGTTYEGLVDVRTGISAQNRFPIIGWLPTILPYHLGTTADVFGVDSTDPTITASRIPLANANGWNNTNVTVSYTASDALSGINPAASNLGDDVLTAEGAGQSASGTAVDNAGNSATATVTGINIDKTAPTLTYTIPAPNGNGWYNINVPITWLPNDTLSGIDTALSNLPPDITGEGTTQQATGSVTDMAGNSTSTTTSAVKIDQTAPGLVKDMNRTGMDQVTVTLTGSDAMSGVDNIQYSTDGGATWNQVNGTIVSGTGPNSMATSFVLTGVGDYNLGHLVFDVAGNQYVLADQTITLEGATTGGTATLTPALMITVNMMGTTAEYPVTPDGRLLVDAQTTSPDGKATLEIAAGTLVLNNDLTPAYLNEDDDIMVKEAGTPAAPPGYQMIAAYEASPSGVTFSPDASLVITYDPDKLPEGSSAVIAYYDEAANKWEPLETAGYVAAAGIEMPDTVVSHVGHFTYFAVLAKLPAGE